MEVEEVEEEKYWCDKKWNRTVECQSWVSPEEQAIYDAKVKAYQEKMAARAARTQSTEEILLNLNFDDPVDINQWKRLAGIPIDDDSDFDENDKPVLNEALDEFLAEQAALEAENDSETVDGDGEAKEIEDGEAKIPD